MPDRPNVIVLPPVLFAGGFLAGMLIHACWTVHPFPTTQARIIGTVLLIVGGIVGIWGEKTMRRAGTNVIPTQPTLAIVTDGPFRFTRNPLYFALTLFYLGVTLLLNAAAPLMILLPVLLVTHYGIVLREERYLEGKFGETYLAYKRRVRRYL